MRKSSPTNMAKGKGIEREDNHDEAADAKKKAKIDVRRSPRKKKAKHSDDESDGFLVKTPLKKGQWVAPSRSRAYRGHPSPSIPTQRIKASNPPEFDMLLI